MGEYGKPKHNRPCDPDWNKLEILVTCRDFSDVAAWTIPANHPHCDNMIVVTSHEDTKTQQLCQKQSVQCVQTDLFNYNEAPFNKGAAINHGMGYFRFPGWRLHLDIDIVLPDNFHRILFNHTPLDASKIYGAQRVDVIGVEQIEALMKARMVLPQHMYHTGISALHGGAVFSGKPSASGAAFCSDLFGPCPIGFFQLWHASHHRPYPHSSGTAAYDDVLFAASWPTEKREILSNIVTYHISPQSPPYFGQNWGGRGSGPIEEPKLPEGFKSV